MSLAVSLTLRAGDRPLTVQFTAPGTVVLIGPNGAGKTTLLRAILGLHGAAGSVLVGGVPIDGLAVEERRLGYVPQRYALFPHRTVRENVAFGAPRTPAGEALVAAMLAQFSLAALADRPAHALSGGEQQRVALARALARSPRALLLDEPLAPLDLPSRRAVRSALAETLARVGLPAIVATHDREDAVAFGGLVVALEDGAVRQVGTLAALTAAPASPFVAAFTGAG